MLLKETKGYKAIASWLAAEGRQPFAFQEEAWEYILQGRSGLVNAPTGCGKTFSVFLGSVIDFINRHPDDYRMRGGNGLQLLWISPLRALAKDIGRAMEEVLSGLGMRWQVGTRNGDTDPAERARQKRKMPEVLIITPESLHLLLAQKNYPEVFKALKLVAVDEWHELLGSKRGVQVELALARILGTRGGLGVSIIGISATIGNLEQAADVLLASVNRAGAEGVPVGEPGPDGRVESAGDAGFIVRAVIHKPIDVESIFPDEIEKYPWSGHLGLKLIHKVIPIIMSSRTTLIFINTRGMSETWYQSLLNICPDLAGAIALHHGSIDMELRTWVEEALHEGKLKAVVCTASLDLGVDFRPVETVIQVGSPKGVARFLQRAGRSGHQPGQVSKIWFLPTHSLELMEAAALKSAMHEGLIESREPMLLSFDVLIQFLSTLAISDGFYADELFRELKQTYCYREMTEEEWREILYFITQGGEALQQYDEYRKVELMEGGLYKINSRRVAMRHRLHIGTIVSEPMLKVRWVSGGYVGVIEEYFISRMEPGEAFTLAGRNLELVMIKDMTVLVRKSNAKKSRVPSWNGGRMPLSANLGMMLRRKLDEASLMLGGMPEGGEPGATRSGSRTGVQAHNGGGGSRADEVEVVGRERVDIELRVLRPLFELQAALSYMPRENELLIEQIET
ncbi:MAG TPA: DEAD/DEAH box helicase, partial [Puia sp.]|nr:DEAD/DEAH box helicase [Puia sp.]